MTLAIDISNYSGEITYQQVSDLVAAGVKRVVVQCVSPSILSHRQQIQALAGSGIEAEAYVYLWMATDVAERVGWACDELAAFPQVKRLWLDCEDTTAGPTQPVVRAAIQSAITASTLPVGIYSSGWWWNGATGSWKGCSGLPLWDANYDGRTVLDVPTYGGWLSQEMKQYRGDTTIAGIPNVDLDWYEEDEMTTHALSQDEMIVAGRAIGAGAGLALSGVGGRSIRAVDDSPPGTRAYVVTVLEEDTKGV